MCTILSASALAVGGTSSCPTPRSTVQPGPMRPTTCWSTRTSAVRTRCRRARTRLRLGARWGSLGLLGSGLLAAVLGGGLRLGGRGGGGALGGAGLLFVVRLVTLAVAGGAAVGAVPTATLENHAGGEEQPPQRATAALTAGERRIGKGLSPLDLGAAIGALVDINWHRRSTASAGLGSGLNSNYNGRALEPR